MDFNHNLLNFIINRHFKYMSQCMAKPTIRFMWPSKTQISLHICKVWSVFTDHMCLLQTPGYPKRDNGEPFPYWVDVQADLSLCWLQGRQLLSLPVCFPAHQAPTEKGSALKGKRLGGKLFNLEQNPSSQGREKLFWKRYCPWMCINCP